MKERYLFIVLAAAAVLAGCQKEGLPDRNPKKVAQSTEFTATVEDVVETRTTFNPTDLRISWEKGDRVNINGSSFISQNAGASTTLMTPTIEVHPQFVSSPSDGFQDQKPSMLVDDKGTETKWCANNDHKGGAAWTIIVSTDASYKLQAIKLWNGGDTQKYPGRRWKNVKVSGSASASGTWEELKSFQNLDLAANNGGLAGTLDVNATAPYKYYKIEISDIVDGDTMQMSDMKFLILDEKITGPYTAYFPETLYNNNKPTLPSSVSETWTEGRFNMPMYAQSTTKDLQFKNLCGMLKVIVKNDQLASVKNIVVGSSNCATSGAFTVKDNKAVLTSPSATANTLTISYTKAVQTTPEGTVFYIPIPAQTYRDLEILMTSNDGFRKIMTIKSGEDFVVERNRIYTIDFVGSEAPAPAGALPGVFSVSASKKVHFSQGNLQYQATTNTWRFAESQLDYIGSDNANTSYTYSGWIDLFGWGTGDDPAKTGPSSYPSFTDWGSNPISNGGNMSNLWRTLTKDEWSFLMVNRSTSSGIRYAKATVNGVTGVIILPDDWSTSYYTLSSTNTKDALFSTNTITSSDWTSSLEAHGAVFLPAAGWRDGLSVEFLGVYGYYWSSTPKGSLHDAYHQYFFEGSLNVNYDFRYFGLSVRLVAEE